MTGTVAEDWSLDETQEAEKSKRREERIRRSQYRYCCYVSQSMTRNLVAWTKLEPAYLLPFNTLNLA